MEFMTESRGGGYNRAQVDAYIRELRQAYQQMYDAHMAVLHQQEDLQMRLHNQQMELGACYAQKEAMAQALIQAQRMAAGTAGFPQPGNQMPYQPMTQLQPQQMPSQMPPQAMQQQQPPSQQVPQQQMPQSQFAPQQAYVQAPPQGGVSASAGYPQAPQQQPKDAAPESYRNPYLPPYNG